MNYELRTMNKRIFMVSAFALTAVCCVQEAPPAAAQASNGTFTLLQDTISTAGGFIGSSNPISAQTILGLAAAGAASNGTFTLMGGVGSHEPPTPPPITGTTNVSGTVNDASASVTVNDLPAIISGTTFTASGVPLTLGPNTLTAVAKDVSGNSTSKSIKVYFDLPDAKKTPRFPITVQGSVNDPTSAVVVNGVTATVASGQFSASVILVSGLNTLTATATDPAGNTATTTIRVFVPLPTRPPAMPTVGTAGDPIPTVTTQSSLTLGGTKTAGTSIWINGTKVVSLSDATTWTATLTLVEGDNDLVIVAKDSSGAASAEVDVNIIVDNLPPVITTTPPTKTNLNPFVLTGTVDDSLTRVDVNGLQAARSGRSFQVSLPLVYGLNNVTITATSPNHYVSTKSLTITLGHIPTIQTAQPLDGTKLYAGAATSIQLSATDLENDPIQYQIVLDGAPLWDWGSNASQAWTPGSALIGLHTVTIGVRDAFGGSNTQSAEVFIVRPPINHP